MHRLQRLLGQIQGCILTPAIQLTDAIIRTEGSHVKCEFGQWHDALKSVMSKTAWRDVGGEVV
jgi:hypothetical protein